MKNLIVLIALVALATVALSCAPAPTPAPTSAPPTAAPAQPPSAPTTAPVQPPSAPTTAPVQPPSAPTTVPTTAPTQAPAGPPIKIGMLTDRTGPLSVDGPTQEYAFALGLEYATGGTNAVAGRPIQVIIRDCASNVDLTTQLAREMLEKDNVDFIYGPSSSASNFVVDDLAQQYKRIVITPAVTPDITGKNFNPYVFRTDRTNVQDSLAMGGMLTKIGKTFVQIQPDYAFGYGSATAYYNVIKANGGKFAINDTPEKNGAIFIPLDTKDFTPYLQKVLDTKADVVVMSWTGAGVIPLMQQMQQLGLFKSMTVATTMASNTSIKAGYAPAVGAVFTITYHWSLPKTAINDWFVQHYRQKYNVSPDLFTEGAFVNAQMVVAGLKATNGDASADKLIKFYENNYTFDGPKGKYTVRPYDHVMLQPEYLVRLTNVTDPDFKFFELVQELKPEDTAPPCELVGEYQSRCPKK